MEDADPNPNPNPHPNRDPNPDPNRDPHPDPNPDPDPDPDPNPDPNPDPDPNQVDDAGTWNPNQGVSALPGDHAAAEMDERSSPGPHARGWRGELFTPPEARLTLTLTLTLTLPPTLTLP